MAKDLYSSDPIERLEAARQIDKDELSRIRNDLIDGCPVEPWPYGSPTVINPFIVTLGPSPGASPELGDTGDKPYSLPTAGEPHPGSYYRDSNYYWDKMRFLAYNTLQDISSKCLFESDALSLYGNLNLDTKQHKSAEDVKYCPEFVNWMLCTIRDKLRPRFIVMLGLKGMLGLGDKSAKKTEIIDAFACIFPEVKLKKPNRKERFAGHTYSFQEWDVKDDDNQKMTLTLWPNSHTRPPVSSCDNWKSACNQFLKIDRP